MSSQVGTTRVRLLLLAAVFALSVAASYVTSPSAEAVEPSPFDEYSLDAASDVIGAPIGARPVAIIEASCFDAYGNVYFTETDWDSADDRVVRVDPSGQRTVVWSGDELSWPKGMTVAADGTIWVVDGDYHYLVEISPQGQVSTFGGYGSPDEGDPSSNPGSMDEPSGVAIDEQTGFVYISDYNNGRILRFNSANHTWLIPFGSYGAGSDQFAFPDGLHLHNGFLYVAEEGNNRISVWNTSLYENAGIYRPQVSMIDVLSAPRAVTVDYQGTMYVADLNHDQFVRILADGTAQGAWPDLGTAEIPSPNEIYVDIWTDVWVTSQGGAGDPSRIRRYVFESGDPDLVPPNTTINSLPSEWWAEDVAITLTSTDASSPIAATYWAINGGEENYYDGPFMITSEGVNNISYYAVDTARQVETSKTATVRIDKTLPTVANDALPQYIAAGTIHLTGFDALSGVAWTEYRTNKNGAGYGMATRGSTVTIISPGSYVLDCRATDGAGNTSDWVSTSFTVLPADDDPPHTTPNGLPTGWTNTPVTVELTATDVVSSVQDIFWKLNSGNETTYTVPVSITTDGQHTFKYWAVDTRGNSETTHTASIWLDGTSPVTTDNVQESYIGTTTVTLTPTDNLSGVVSTSWRLNSGNWQTGTSITVPLGRWTLQYRSNDLAGNSEVVKSREVLVLAPDNDPPSTTSNITDNYVPSPFPIQFDAYDGVSGVAHTYYSIDGTFPTLEYTVGQTIWVSGDEDIIVKYYSIDERGNIEPLRTQLVRLDSVPPVTTSNALQSYIGTATVTLSATDNRSGVAGTYYKLDNQPQVKANSVTITSYGEHTLKFWSQDGSGLLESENTATFEIIAPDEVAPVTTYYGPTGWVLPPAAFSFTATDDRSDVAATYYSTDGGYPAQQYYGIPISYSVDGSSTIQYYSKDEYNNREVVKSAEILIDGSAPVTTHDGVLDYDGKYRYRDEAVINLSATDPYSGVSYTKWKVDSGTWHTGSVATATGYSSHTLYYYSVDALGNTEGIKTMPFVIVMKDQDVHETDDRVIFHDEWTAGQSPAWWVTNGVAYADETGAKIIVAFQGTDLRLYAHKGPNMGRASISIDGGTPVTRDFYQSYTSNATLIYDSLELPFADHIAVISWTGTKNGSSSGYRISYDFARIEGNVLSVTDVVAPLTTSNVSASWVHGPVVATLTSTDATTGVQAVYAKTGGSIPTTSPVDLYTSGITVSAEGQTPLKYFALDKRGNIETVRTSTIKIDNSPPSTTPLTAILPTYAGGGTVTLRATDLYSGAGTTYWRVDGGAWNTGTALAVPATLGSHFLEWYSTDLVGNTETISSATVTTVARFEETASGVYLRGTWSTVNDGQFSGSTGKATNTSGSSVYVTFTGTQIDWIAKRDTDRGKANVILDGGAPISVDLYGASAYKLRVWSSGTIAAGTHTLRIDYTGTKNTSSSGYTIGLDALDVVGALVPDTAPPSTTDNAPPSGWITAPTSVTLTPVESQTWLASTQYKINGGTTTPYTAPISVGTEGQTTIEYWSTDGAGNAETHRFATVRLDMTNPSTTDDGSSVWTQGPVDVHLLPTDAISGVQETRYSLDGSAPSLLVVNNTVQVSQEGTTVVRYAATDVAGHTESTKQRTIRIDNTAPESTDDALLAWQTAPLEVELTADDALSGVVSIQVSVDGGAPFAYDTPLTLSADGTHTIDYYAVDSASNEEISHRTVVKIDKTKPVTTATVAATYHDAASIDLTATDAVSGVAATEWRIDNGAWVEGTTAALPATPGLHTLQWRSTDVAGNVEDANSADYSMYGRTEQTDSNIYYKGEWYRVDNAALSSASMTKTTFSGTGAYVTFHGTGIDWIGLKSTKYGIAKVTLDGGAPEYVDLYDATPGGLWQAKIWSVSGLPNADHTVRIEWTGTKNAAAEDYALNIDALDVAGTLLTDQTVPASTCSATGAWRATGESVTMTASDANSYVAAIRYRVNGGAETLYSAPFVVSTSGVNTIEYWCVDGAGNEEVHKTAYVRLDRGLPNAFNDAPVDWTRGPITVHVTANDADSGVSYIVYSTDGASPNKLYNTGIAVSAEGTTTVKYRAIDMVGNSTPITSASVRIDNTAPTSGDNAPSEWRNSAVNVVLSSNDALSGVEGIRFSFDGSVAATYTDQIAVSSQGVHSIQYWGVDRAGNAESPKTATVRIDTTAPTTTSNLVSDYYGASSVALSPTDAASGVALTEWKVDDGEWTASATAALPSTPGVHTLSWRSTDSAGNVEEVQSGTFTMYERTEQTDSRIYWKGQWYRVDNASLSSASMMKTVFSGTVAYVTFDGTGIDWIALKSPNYGIARVTLDGGAPQDVDLYDAAPGGVWKSKVWSASDLEDTRHTLKIEWTGTKNAASADYALNIDAFDVAGTLVADEIAPVTTSSATGTWRTTNEQVSFSAADVGSYVGSIKYRINGGAEQTYATPFTVSSEGVTTISYYAIDGAGNTENANVATVKIDKTAPALTNDAPTAWQNGPVDVHLTTSDAHSGIETVVYSTNGDDPTTPYENGIAVSAEGTTTVRYQATDLAGNTTAIGSATVRIDQSAPGVTDNISAGWTNDPIVLTGSDALSGVKNVYLGIDEAEPVTFTAPVTPPNGTHTVSYYAIDHAGNTMPTQTKTIHFDDIAPSSGDNAPTDWRTSSVNVALDATDAMSGVDEIRYSIDGSDPAVYADELAFSADGVYTIQYWASDHAGNTESANTATVRVDKTAPVTTSNALAAYYGASTVSLGATDAVSGVASSEWRIDGGGWTSGTAAALPATPGHHTLEWRSTDVAGNTEATKSATYSMYGRVEQTDSRIYWKGSWYRVDNASLSSASMMKTTFSGTSAYVTFQGTGIDWIALKSTKYGIAKVTLDGGAPDFVDLYDSTPGGVWKAKVWSASDLSDAQHTLKIEWTGTKNAAAEDYALNIDALDVAGTLLADGIAPDSTCSASGTWRKTSETVTLSATEVGSYLSAIKYRINGGSEQTYSTPFTISSEGVTTITYYAIDGAGNVELSENAYVRIDKTAPTLSNDAPSSWTNDTTTVHVNATDPLSGVQSILYSTDGSDPSLTYGSGILVSNEGTTTVRYKASDTAGNTTSIGSATVRIDTVDPSVTDNIAEGWTTHAITLSGTDSLSGLRNMYFRTDGSVLTTYTAAVTPTDGVHLVEYQGVDNAGNYMPMQTKTIRFDSTAPVTTSGAVASSYYATTTVSLAPSDAHSGVEKTEWRIDSDGWSAGTTATLPFSAGRHTLQWRSTDVAGNVEQTKSATYDMWERVEQTDSRIYWKGEWYRIDNNSLSGKSMQKTTFTGTGAYVTFHGTGISWVALKSPGYGIARVTLDGGPPEMVDLYDPSSQWQSKAWTASNLTDTDHTLAIEWTGTKNPAASTIALNVDAFEVAGTMTDFRTAVEDTDSKVYFDPAWFRIDNASLSGGTMRKAIGTGSAAFTFRGTGFDYTALKSPRYGVALVTIDNTTTRTVDLYDPGSAWKSNVLSISGLTETTHTVTIAWTGQKNANATANEVNVDKIAVRGLLQQYKPTFQQNDAKIWYGPDWYNVNSVNLSGGSMSKVNEADSPAFVSFRGTEIAWVGLKTVSYGKAKVTLDGGAPETVDLYSASDAWQSKIWTRSGLNDTTHTVTIEWTGTKNASSTGTAIGVDGFEVVGSLATASPTQPVYTRFDQADSKVAFAGSWFPVSSFNVHGGSLAKTTTTGDTAYVSFTGTAFKWLAVKTPSYGIARLTLDGGTPQFVDLYSATDQWKSKVWAVSGLTNTAHTVKIEWTGDKNPLSSGSAIAIDGFDVIGALTQATASGPRVARHEQTDPHIAYSGSWSAASSWFLSGESGLKADGPTGSASVTWTGTECSWIGLKSPKYGIAKVTVDGGAPTFVDLYSPTDQWMSRVWHVEGLANATHTVTVEWTGTKNISANGTSVLIDAFDVMGTLQ